MFGFGERENKKVSIIGVGVEADKDLVFTDEQIESLNKKVQALVYAEAGSEGVEFGFFIHTTKHTTGWIACALSSTISIANAAASSCIGGIKGTLGEDTARKVAELLVKNIADSLRKGR